MTGGDIVPALAGCVVIAMSLTLENYYKSSQKCYPERHLHRTTFGAVQV